MSDKVNLFEQAEALLDETVEAKDEELKDDESVEAKADDDNEVKAEESEEESAVEASALSTPASKYIDVFGLEQGSIFYATGVPFVEALGQHLKAQEETISKLQQQVTKQATAGEEEPLGVSEGQPKPKFSATKLPAGWE